MLFKNYNKNSDFVMMPRKSLEYHFTTLFYQFRTPPSLVGNLKSKVVFCSLLYVLVVHETFLMLWKEYFLLSWDIIFLLGLWPFSLYHCRSFFFCTYDFRVYSAWLFEISDEMTLFQFSFFLTFKMTIFLCL